MESLDIFNCIKCGDCCKGYGGAFVTPDDIKAISKYINTDPEHFIEEFCQISGGKPLLAQGENGYCVFWNEVCTIHPVKPRMCKEWPFINAVLVDIENWHIMASFCPGIRTDVPVNIVQEYVRKKLSND
ncbi:MAG: YkgJ family cysteine cluster protein [Deltaproteobacteria bacterium]|nr:YkgJ family cysteine cluster protein [Deltaproteobacteria bacterium]